MRRSPRGAAAALALAAALIGAPLALLGAPAAAHTPHDETADVAVSPAFTDDRTVWAVTHGALAVSTDAGATWRERRHGLPHDIAEVEVAPADAEVLYVAAAFGRMARSDDGGRTWAPTATAPAFGVTSMAVSPVETSTVLVATRDDGARLTVDGGDSWAPAGGPPAASVVAFGAEAALLVGTPDGEVHRSEDNGATWRPATFTGGAPSSAVTALAGGGDEVVYAGFADGGVARSDDDGRTFTVLGAGDGGLPGEAVASLARSPEHAADGTVWASLVASGTFRSTDRGATWQPAGDGLTTDVQADELGRDHFATVVAGRDGDGTVLFVAGFDGLFRSTDGGAGWRSAETLADRIVGIAVSPAFATDRTVAVATYLKGAYLSTDAGGSWRPINDGLEYPLSEGNELAPVRRLLGIAFSPAYARDRSIYSTSWVGFLLHRPTGWSEVLLGQGDPGDEAVLQRFVTAVAADGTTYLGSRSGEVRRSADVGLASSWEVVGQVDGAIRSLLVGPAGELWAATSTDVHRRRGSTAPFEPTGLGAASMIAGSLTDGPVVFAGTAEGLLVTRDGQGWEPVDVVGDGAPTRIEAIGVSPAFGDDGLVLVSVDGSGLYRSTDGGATFAPVGTALAAADHLVSDVTSNPVSAPIQFSPRFAEDGTVFAYSDRFVLRSTDRGSTWTVLELPSMFELLATDAPGELERLVTPGTVAVPPAGREAGPRAAAWVVVAAGAAALAGAALGAGRRPGTFSPG